MTWTCGTHCAAVGHRIRLEVSSSAFNAIGISPAPLGKTSEMQVAEQKIYHDRANLSYVVLPIVPR
jgi:predicted acyl esterase